MAVKNLQTVASCVADIHGVRVTGTGSMRFTGTQPAPFQTLPGLPLVGSYAMPTRPEAEADNAATAKAEVRTGRSASEASARIALSKRFWA